jgi:cytoskeletal protein CcmA (bactofilin family)
VNPLSENQKTAKYSQSRIDTLIGAGTCIKGNVTFTGVLRAEGEIIGDVSCGDDPLGTIVVGKLGRVTGTVNVPHIVVIGHVDGPVHSSESLEIQPAARVVGDAFYKDIVIHEGAVIEGVLTPSLPMEEDRSGPEHRAESLEPPAVKKPEEPPAVAMAHGSETAKRSRTGRNVGLATALLIAVFVIVWLIRSPTAVTPPAAEDVRPANTSVTESPAAQSPPVEVAKPLESPKAVVVSAAALVPSSKADSKLAVQAIPTDSPEPKNVVVVQGDNPAKPGDFVFVVVGKESVVLFKKQRKDPGEGTRIELAQGPGKKITMAKEDILRVAQGRGIQMFYQGRKLAPGTFEGGAWMSFVPVSRDGATGQ